MGLLDRLFSGPFERVTAATDDEACDVLALTRASQGLRATLAAGGRAYFTAEARGTLSITLRRRRRGDPLGNHTGEWDVWLWDEDSEWNGMPAPPCARELRPLLPQALRRMR